MLYVLDQVRNINADFFGVRTATLVYGLALEYGV